MDSVTGLFDFIKKSPTAYQAVGTLRETLLARGYTELYEGDEWSLLPGGRYFVRRSGSSLIAFRVPAEKPTGFMIAASHSDSPAFRVKRNAETVGAYTRLLVERYGGMIYYTWLDRPLSVAGRVFVKTEDGVEERLVHIDRDLLVIPSVAIHMNRQVNDGYKFNPATDLIPLVGDACDKGDFDRILAEAAGASAEEIVAHDLFLCPRVPGVRFGAREEFILAPRLDDLECVYASLEGFLSAEGKKTGAVPVFAVFDNEEVGSETKQGAASTFLSDTLRRIGGEAYSRMLDRSFMVSADNAHAKHPDHPEYCDPENAPLMNGGVVIKYNANQRYATDGISDSLFRTLCERKGVPVQTYFNRADLPGGSTLGSISDTRVSIPTVDIGLAQLAMHAAVETAGAKDIDPMIAAFDALFSSSITKKDGRISLCTEA